MNLMRPDVLLERAADFAQGPWQSLGQYGGSIVARFARGNVATSDGGSPRFDKKASY